MGFNLIGVERFARVEAKARIDGVVYVDAGDIGVVGGAGRGRTWWRRGRQLEEVGVLASMRPMTFAPERAGEVVDFVLASGLSVTISWLAMGLAGFLGGARMSRVACCRDVRKT